MSLQRYLDVANAPDLGSLKAQLVGFAHDMDFGIVSSGLVVEKPGASTPAETHWLANTPQAFIDSFFSAPDVARDPVLARMKKFSLPFAYDRRTYVADGAGDLWEHQAQFGYKTGVAVALHLPQGRHFLLGMDRERALPRADNKLTRLLADLQLLAVHAQEAASRLFTPHLTFTPPALSARELEILRWTMEGKSAWAIGAIVGLSEHGVNYHYRAIFRKLEVSSKQQAMVKAMSLGLI